MVEFKSGQELINNGLHPDDLLNAVLSNKWKVYNEKGECNVNPIHEILKTHLKGRGAKNRLRKMVQDADSLTVNSLKKEFSEPADFESFYNESIATLISMKFSEENCRKFRFIYLPEHGKGKSAIAGLTEKRDILKGRNILVFKIAPDSAKGKRIWIIGQKNSEKKYSNMDGFLYIQWLLKHKYKEVDCYALNKLKGSFGLDNQNEPVDYNNSQGIGTGLELPDRKALNDYREELIKTKSEIEDLEKMSLNQAGKEHLYRLYKKDELLRKAITDEYFKRKNTRKTPEDKKLRDNIQKRIKDALKEISQDSFVSNCLNDKTITTGYTCRYNPDSHNDPSLEIA